MKAIHPYLNFKDNTEEAFNFYKSVIGGEFEAVSRFSDIPWLLSIIPPFLDNPSGSGDIQHSNY